MIPVLLTLWLLVNAPEKAEYTSEKGVQVRILDIYESWEACQEDLKAVKEALQKRQRKVSHHFFCVQNDHVISIYIPPKGEKM